MITAHDIETALGITGVILSEARGVVSIVADQTVTDEMRAKVQAWHDKGAVTTHKWQPTRVVLSRMTAPEKAALRAAAVSVPEVADAYDIALSVGTISEIDDDFPLFVMLLDQLGIIESSRWEVLLNE